MKPSYRELTDFILHPLVLSMLFAAADRGDVAVRGIEYALLAQFGDVAKCKGVKLNVGRIVHQIMVADGYHVQDRHVPLDSLLFWRGARYAKVENLAA